LCADGGQVDPEPAGAEPLDTQPLSQDHSRSAGDRAALCRPLPGGSSQAALADHPGPGRDRRPAARGPGGPFLPRLLRLPLLSAALRLLWPPPAGCLLRRSNQDAAAGAVEEVARIVGQIRGRWPRTRILLRGDSGFAREGLMAGCETNRVDFLFGLARNARLARQLCREIEWAEDAARRRGRPARRYQDFLRSTLESWSRRRRVVAKAEWLGDKAKPRFVVTSLKSSEVTARRLYERLYCARGDMENRIKECQLDLFADRTSTGSMRANQLRLWFASLAYVLLCALRRIGLAHTRFATATCGTLR